MSNIDAYEQNLTIRLEELRNDDPAYELHKHAIIEAILYSHEIHGYKHKPRILDCGCGLGFLTVGLKEFYDIDGIDPSPKSIEIAREEHPEITFYQSTAEAFPEIMKKKHIDLYDHAILNMVLHSVDDDTVRSILKNLRHCLRPEGSLIIVTPGDFWISQKLIEYAQDQEIIKKKGISWVKSQLNRKQISLPYKISNGDYYPKPLTFYNRNLKDYGDFLLETGYGVKIGYYSEEGKLLSQKLSPFETIDVVYTCNNKLGFGTNRNLIISYVLEE